MARVKVNRKKTKTTKSSNTSLWQLNVILLFLVLQSSYLVYSNLENISSFFKADSTDSLSEVSNVGDNSFDETLKLKNLRNKEKKPLSSFFSKEKLKGQIEKNNSSSIGDSNSKKKKLDRPVRISILNGCRVSGIAARWKRRLRKKKYDVRDTGNSNTVSRSTVISRISDMSYAYELADKLGISHKNVIQQINRSIVDVDVTLIIGKDYTRLKKDWK